MSFLASRLRQISAAEVEEVTLDSARTESMSTAVGAAGPVLGTADIMEVAKQSHASLLILDLPWSRFKRDDLESMLLELASGTRVVGVDGPTLTRAMITRIFPTVSRPEGPCLSPQCFWGPSWVMASRRGQDSTWVPGKNCLILTGSTESDHYLNQLSTNLLPQTKKLINFFWAPGPYASDSVKGSAKSNGLSLVEPAELDEAKNLANLSICRFGVSAIEMMALGVPTIILPDFQDRERSEVSALRDLNLAIVIDDYRLLPTAAEALANSPDRATELSRNCLKHFSPPTEDQFREVFTLT